MPLAVRLACALVAAISLIAPAACHADAKTDYELSERCGKRAEEVFHADFAGSAGSRFESHYSAALNKCTITVIYIGPTEKPNIATRFVLDANDRKVLGHLIRSVPDGDLVSCEAIGKKCSNTDEWEAAMRPYTGE